MALRYFIKLNFNETATNEAGGSGNVFMTFGVFVYKPLGLEPHIVVGINGVETVSKRF